MDRTVLALVAVCAMCVSALSTQARAGADDRELVFDPPLSVNIRQTNGVAARGEILSMNEKDLLLRSVSGKEVRLKLERVRSIKTSNETFEYWPGDEPFSDLCARADKVPGAKLMGENPQSQTGRSPRRAAPKKVETEEVDPGDLRGRAKDSPADALPSGSDILKPGRPGVNIGSARGRRDEDLQAEHQAMERGGPRNRTQKPQTDVTDGDEPAESTAEPQPGSVVYSCSHCNKELPLSFRSGDACPHCGRLVVFENESAETAAQATPAPVKNPFATGGQAAAIPVPAPVAVPVAAVPATSSPSASGGSMGLSDVPMIAKVGIFAAFLIVGWFLLNRR